VKKVPVSTDPVQDSDSSNKNWRKMGWNDRGLLFAAIMYISFHVFALFERRRSEGRSEKGEGKDRQAGNDFS
jgi:hypothetical protein